MTQMVVSLILLLCLTALPSYAQNTAELRGVIIDRTGAVLPGVSLTLTHKTGNQERRQLTDTNGNYVFASLPNGDYLLKAEFSGFKSQIRDGITLQVGQRINVDLSLEVGAIDEEVTVTEDVSLMRTTNAEISEVISNQRLGELPLNGRQFVQLTLLSDNVFLTPVGTRGAALSQTGRQVVIGGQRVGHNLYTLDGVSITDQYLNNLVISPSIEALQEFKIQKSIYSAEFGGKSSANVNAVTKAGTNQYHGTFLEFLRNDVFDAKNYFDPATKRKPPLRLNQFGGSLGGRLTKDRVFFFANYEGSRERRGLTRTFSVPSLKVRSGDFSGMPAIYDPTRTDATGRRLPFPDNKIPLERLNPVALAFLERVPLPTTSGDVQNFVASPSIKNDSDQATVRLDYSVSPRNALFLRFTGANMVTFQPYGNSNLNETLVPGFGYQIVTRSRNIALSHTHVFSPSTINEFRMGFLRVTGGQESENRGVDFGRTSGVQGVTRDPSKMGYPAVNFADAYSSMGDPATLTLRRNNSFDFFDSLSWTEGPHSLKFGTYIYRLRFNPMSSPNARGTFNFSPRFTSSVPGAADGNAFADFLLGYPSSAQVGIGRGETDGRALWTHFYAQDDWRASTKLTLNLGVRYEINAQMVEDGNRFSNPELDRFVVASDDSGKIHPDATEFLTLLPVPYVTSKTAGYHRSLQRPNYNRMAPRIGLAWAPDSGKRYVVRAGFGLFFNQAGYSINENLALNLPFYFNKSVTVPVDQGAPLYTTTNILSAPNTGSVGGSGLMYKYRSEYAESWTLSVQRAFRDNWAVMATYLGSKVVGADNTTYFNVPQPGPGPIDARRPNPALSAIRTIRWDGWSSYNSMTLKLEKRFSSRFAFDANYTLSKSMDDASDVGPTFHEFNVPQDVRNIGTEKGLSSFHHAHRFVFTGTYELPMGWTVNTIGTFQTGAPITANLPNDNANVGPGPAQRPDLLRNPNLKEGRTAERWFDTDAFAMPAPFTFGNAGRNIVYEDGETNIDLSVTKQFDLREKARLEFRTEVFNVFNFLNFVGAPGRIAFTPNFGRLFNAGPSRQMQLGLKLTF
jgi:Carboxypeptidase regulatory-like domain